jgi:hypothetical protein
MAAPLINRDVELDEVASDGNAFNRYSPAASAEPVSRFVHLLSTLFLFNVHSNNFFNCVDVSLLRSSI